MQPTDHHFPTALDSTMLSVFKSCPYKFFTQYCQHWKPRGESVHLIAGGAFAKGLEVSRRAFYIDGRSQADAVAFGVDALLQRYGTYEPMFDTPKTAARMAGALEYYFEVFPLISDIAPPLHTSDGSRAIEFSFQLAFGEHTHPETGNPLMYCGRADMICEFAGGVWITDEKTTTSLGASWGKQWENRSQFTAYCWACRQFCIQPDGVLVRGVSILKTKYDHAQVITRRPDWEISRWYSITNQTIERMLACWEVFLRTGDAQHAFPLNLDHACGEYGGCVLLPVCKAEDPAAWLESQFTQRVWDPVAHEELTVQQYNERFAK